MTAHGRQHADHEDHQTTWASPASRCWRPRGWRRARSAASEEERRRLNEQLEKERWESEGGASRTGPATQSAVTAH